MSGSPERYVLTGDQLLDLVEYTAPGLGETVWSSGDELDAWLTQRDIVPIEALGLVVVERGRLLDMLADSFRAGVAEEADVVATGSVNERADEIAHAFLASLTEQQP